MKFSTRRRTADAPGLVATARVDRRTQALLPRLGRGEIAVLNHLDLDQASAQGLLDRGVAAVVDAAPFISGRYPNLGPELLVAAGVELVEIDPADLALIRDGRTVRLHEGGLYVGDELCVQGHTIDAELVRERMQAAREGMVTQLASFTHNSVEFLRREEDLLLHGRGIPRPATAISGRPVLVVAAGQGHREQLRGVRRFVREQHPVLIGVGRGADALTAAGLAADIVVLDSGRDVDLPAAKVLRETRDVVVRVERGAPAAELAALERLSARPVRCETGATAEDVALLLADHADAQLLVGAGLHASLDEFLDRQRSGLGSTYLTRLKVGARLVDARAVPTLYSGRVRPVHLLWVLLACLVALAAAVGVTPVGQYWAQEATEWVRGALVPWAAEALDTLQGLFR